MKTKLPATDATNRERMVGARFCAYFTALGQPDARLVPRVLTGLLFY